MDKKYKFTKDNPDDKIKWVDNPETKGEFLFTFDEKKIYNLFRDYPQNLTKEEMDDFHLSTLRLSYEEACKEYEYRANTKLGKLISNRELPILHRAKEILDKM